MESLGKTSEWVTRPLIEVATLQRGYDLPIQDRTGGLHPIFAANGTVGFHGSSKCKGPGVVTGRSGTIGKVHFVKTDFWPLNTSLYVKNFHGNDPRWVYYMLQSFGLESYSQGAGVPTLNRNLVHGEPVKVPPLPEQRRIAPILDQAETLRTQRRTALALLDTLTQSIFLDMFGDPQSNPKGWKTQALTEFFQFRTGKLDSNAATQDGAYPFFTCSREDFRIDTYAFDCEALLLAGNNANADYSVKHYRGKFNAYQRTYVLTLADAANSYVYARVVLEMKLQELKRESKGSSTKYLTLGLMDRLKLPVPAPALQQTFATRIAAIEALKSTHRAALAQLDALFASLQHRAFSGTL